MQNKNHSADLVYFTNYFQSQLLYTTQPYETNDETKISIEMRENYVIMGTVKMRMYIR